MSASTSFSELEPDVHLVDELRQLIAEQTGQSPEDVSDQEIREYHHLILAEYGDYLEQRSVHRTFERHAAQQPEASAVLFRGESTTFAELNRRANRLARFLRRRSVGAETLVGVCLPPSPDRVVALLAVLKAGGAFVAIAEGARGAIVRAAARPAVVLSAGPLDGDGVIVLEEVREEVCREDGDNPADDVGPGNLACVVYESAGRGVAVEHRQALHRLDWLQAEFELSDSDVLLHHDRDGADWEVFWPLLHGGRVAIAADESPATLIGEHGVTILRLTPSELVSLLADGPTSFPSLRLVLCAGEPLRGALAARLAERSSARLVHAYAPHEAATEVSWQTVTARESRDPVPVGDTWNLSVFLLDRYLQPIPQGLESEICVAGEELPRGFLGDPRGTARSFLPDPFAEQPGARLLRTGDLGRMLPGGALALTGAVGRQVRIAGQRLDLGAVEAALVADPSVDEAAVLVRETADSVPRLAAYVVVSGAWVPERLAERLRSRWADELLPAAWVPVSRLPLTAAGRPDEEALAQLPVIDDELVERWEERLFSLPGVVEGVVLVRETSEALPPMHLDDLLPDWRQTAARPAGDATPAASERPAVAPEAAAPETPAVRHGPALELAAEAPTTLASALERAAALEAERGIVYLQADGSDTFQTYPELLEQAERLLAGLRALGLEPQDKVIFQLDVLEDYIAAFWASMLGGLVPVPLSIAPTYDQPNAAVAKLGNAWRMLERPLVLCGRELAPAVRSLSDLLGLEGLRVEVIDDLRQHPPDRDRQACQPDDLALLLLTSGSTGLPKAVMQTHHALLTRSAAVARNNAFVPEDVSLNWMPLDHVGGLVMFHLRDVYVACGQIQAPTTVVLEDPLRWLDWIERFRATVTWAPNFAFGLVNDRADEIARRRWDLSSMRFILNGGEAIVAKTARTFLRLLRPHGLPETAMKPAWGMSETCSGITYCHHFTIDSTSDEDPFVEVGTPVPEASVRIADAEDRVLAEGAVGLLQVKGPMITAGYYRNPELNEEVFTADGWFNTGDLGVLRDGQLSITGREKDVIIVRGVNHYSHEIEAVVEEIEGVEVSYTAACPVRDAGSDTDELAIFFHTPSEDWDRRLELIEEIRHRVAEESGLSPTYLIPMAREDVPKTAIGKIQRPQLRERFEAGELDDVRKRIDVLTGNENTLPSWFYRKVWVRKELAPRPAVGSGGVLVFLDDAGLGASLCTRLSQRRISWTGVAAGDGFARREDGHFTIDPADPEHYRRLLAALDGREIDRFLHLWTYDDEPVDPAAAGVLERAEERGLLSVLYLVQALAAERGSPCGLWVASSRAQRITDDEVPAPEKTSLLGLLKTLPKELPWLSCRHVDLPASEVDADAARLLQELCAASDEREAAHRASGRWVARLRHVDLLREEEQPTPIRNGGIYLLTGGLGGIAREIAGYLLATHEVRLLLIGRTPLPARDEGPSRPDPRDGTAERVETLRALEQLPGEVAYQAVDVVDEAALRRAVEAAEARWHGELRGVLHLAGVLAERPLLEETRESLAETLRPKVLGGLALHRLSAERPGSSFIAFSSINSFFGGATVGAYAAANSFLDGLSEYRRALGQPSWSLAWSMWDEVGMSRGYEMKELSRARGYHTLTARQGLSSFVAALTRGQDQVLIGLDGTNPHIRRWRAEGPCAHQRLAAFFTGDEVAATRLAKTVLEDAFGSPVACDPRPLAEMPLTEDGEIDLDQLSAAGTETVRAERAVPRDETEEKLAEIWRQVLGTGSPIGIHDNFFHLGGDSILSIQVIARAAEQGLRLTPEQIFRQPTVAELAAVVETAEPLAAEQELVEGAVPLTPIQRWYLEQDLPDPHHFNMALLFEVRQPLDGEVLARTVKRLILHHDALRMRFRREDGDWRQDNAGAEKNEVFQVVDLSAEPEAEQMQALEATAAKLQASLDLTDGPLLRVAYFDLGLSRPGRLLFVVHHLVVDGVSWRILLQNLQVTYEQLHAGTEVRLPPKTTSFKRWAERLEELAQSDIPAAEASYWLAESHRRPPLPVDFRGGRNTEGSSRTVSLRLDGEETQALLQEVPKAYRTQINDVLLTALTQVLTRWTEASTVRIDLEGHGREELFDDVDLSRTVGWFTSLFPVSLELAHDAAPGEALKSIKEQLRGIPRRGVGYGLLRYLRRDEETAAALRELPPAEVSFNYLGQFDQSLAEADAFAMARDPIGDFRNPAGERQHPLDVFGHVVEGRLEIGWIYSDQVHLETTVERLARDFMAALRTLVAHCLSPEAGGCTPSDFPLAGLDQARLDRLVGDGRAVEDVYPLSPIQQGLLFHTLYSPESGVYFDQMSCTLRGDLDVTSFERAWQAVIDRHSILRTGFVWEDLERPLQVVRRAVALPLRHEDWQRTPADARRFSAAAEEDRKLGFDLTSAPLVRLTLIRLGEDSHRFLWSNHHLLLDGWSRALVLKEVFACYEAERRGQQSELEQPASYRHYIAWLDRQDMAEAEDYWRRRLAGFSFATPLPDDRQRETVAESEEDYGNEDFRLSPALTAKLQSQAQRHQLTLNTLVQGAWGRLLSYHSGEDDVVFGTTLSGRPAGLPGVESMVGLLIATLPVRMTVAGDEPLRSWLEQLQEQQVEMRQYEYAPLNQVQSWSEVPAGQPLFESLYVFESFPVDASLREGIGSLEIEAIALFGRGNYPLTLAASPGRELTLQIYYDTTRFDRETVRRLLGHLETFLAGVAESLERPVGEVPLLDAEEGHRRTWAAPPRPRRRRQPARPRSFVAPRTPVEKRLTEIWREVLAVDRIGIHDSFFELGGDSISSIQVIARAKHAGILLSLQQLVKYQTIAALAPVVEATAAPEAIDFSSEDLAGFRARLDEAGIESQPIESAFPLSPMQHGMLFHALHTQESAAMYFEQFHGTFRGDLDPALFHRAWQRVVDRHPELRTAFVWKGLAEPLQVVHRQVKMPLEEQAWLGAVAAEQEQRFADYLAADRARGCDPAIPPLMRLALIRLSEDTWRFVWGVHHLVVDGWSFPLVLQEVFAAYEALSQGREPSEIERVSYRSYIAWLARQDMSRAEVYWRRQLAGVSSPTPLGIDRSPGAGPVSTEPERRGEQQMQLDAATSTALRDLARRHRLTLNTLIQGAWALLLSGYSGTDDVLFGTTVSGRPPDLDGVESMLGMLINTLPVRVRIEPQKSLREWLTELQAAQTEMREYEYTPLVDIQGWSAVARGQPLFESLLVFENTPIDRSLGEELPGIEISDVYLTERLNYPLTWLIGPSEELLILVIYDRTRIADEAIAQVLEHWRALLAEVSSQPDRRLDAIRALAASEDGWQESLARSQAQDQAEEFDFNLGSEGS